VLPTSTPGRIVVVTGPPGAGKSTVAAIVAASADRPTVHLHTDTFYTSIRTGFVPPYLPESAAQNEVVLTAIAEVAGIYAEGGYDVVLDGVVGPWALDRFRAAAARRGLALSYVVLRPAVDVVVSRATAREGAALRDEEPIRGLHGAFSGLGELERCVLDTGAQTPAESAAAVRAAWADPRFRL
jgi:predicted kinase